MLLASGSIDDHATDTDTGRRGKAKIIRGRAIIDLDANIGELCGARAGRDHRPDSGERANPHRRDDKNLQAVPNHDTSLHPVGLSLLAFS
jgi:hypothetical protein